MEVHGYEIGCLKTNAFSLSYELNHSSAGTYAQVLMWFGPTRMHRKTPLQWPEYDYPIFPSIHRRSRLLYELKKMNSVYSCSSVVPKASLHLHLLIRNHFNETHAARASVRAPVPIVMYPDVVKSLDA